MPSMGSKYTENALSDWGATAFPRLQKPLSGTAKEGVTGYDKEDK